MTDVDNIIMPVCYWVAKFLTYNKDVKIALNTTKIAQKPGSQTNCIIKNHPSKVEQSREGRTEEQSKRRSSKRNDAISGITNRSHEIPSDSSNEHIIKGEFVETKGGFIKIKKSTKGVTTDGD